jgi:peptide-methionine (R)-S-oxide reductase
MGLLAGFDPPASTQAARRPRSPNPLIFRKDPTPMKRRYFLLAGLGGLGFLAARQYGMNSSEAAAEAFEIARPDAEWRKLLSPAQYAVLRKQNTERPFSSPLDKEHRTGIFACAGCQLPLYSSRTKFDSGTGWPSFWAPIDNAVRTSEDNLFGMKRTEVHCRRCGGHLGHVFDDGPPPTGLRYCMNGIAMTFTPGPG